MSGRFYHLRVIPDQQVQLVLLGQLVLKVPQVIQVQQALPEMQVQRVQLALLVALAQLGQQVQPQGSEHQQ
jgi:hypothetical protein